MKVLVAHNFYQQPGGEDQVFHSELALLEQHGYIRRVKQDSTGGRRGSDLCEVNPLVINRGTDELEG